MNDKEKEDQLLDKIIQHIDLGILTDKKDLKLYGIKGDTVQKEIIWGIMENQLLTNHSDNKSNLIRKFYRSNLM